MHLDTPALVLANLVNTALRLLVMCVDILQGVSCFLLRLVCIDLSSVALKESIQVLLDAPGYTSISVLLCF